MHAMMHATIMLEATAKIAVIVNGTSERFVSIRFGDLSVMPYGYDEANVQVLTALIEAATAARTELQTPRPVEVAEADALDVAPAAPTEEA